VGQKIDGLNSRRILIIHVGLLLASLYYICIL